MIPRFSAAWLAIALSAPLAAQSISPAAIRPTVDYSTARITSGSWSYQPVPGGSVARFVDATGTSRFALECSKTTRRVTVSRTTVASTLAAPGLFVWTTDASRSLGARFDATAGRVAVELSARDPLLDAMAFSRGRIAVAMPGAEPLVMPAWPEAARTIEDCRI
jgi:hypothetical protein